jgi:hypothetical protein
MLCPDWRMLAAYGAILLALLLNGCDSVVALPTPTALLTPASPTSRPTAVPTETPVPTLEPTSIPVSSDYPATPFPTPVMGPGRFTGTFLMDWMPDELDFLNLTQSGAEVSGFFTIVLPDVSNGGKPKATNVVLNGSTDSEVVTLNGVYPYAGAVYIARRTEAGVLLTYPSRGGRVGSREFKPASEAEFNHLLDVWQKPYAPPRGAGAGAYLGVDYTQLTQANAAIYNIKDEHGTLVSWGVLVTKVESGTPAEQAGVKTGDVIIAVDAFIPTESYLFRDVMQNFLPYETVTLDILRNGKMIEIKATLGTRP